MRKTIGLALIFGISGCAALNPYHENDTCPGQEFGKCMSIRQAYEESFERSDPAGTRIPKPKKGTPLSLGKQPCQQCGEKEKR